MDTLSRRKEGLASGSLVCLTGSVGSGKSEVLMNVVANCTLAVEFGGNGSKVHFFSVDSKFNISRLIAILKFKILSFGCSPSVKKATMHPSILDQHVEDSLSRVIVHYPESTPELILLLHRFSVDQENITNNDITINNENKCVNVTTVSSGNIAHRINKVDQPLTSLIIIDGIGTKYYPNKVFDEINANNSSSSSSYTLSNLSANLSKVLKQILAQDSLSILIGQQAIFSSLNRSNISRSTHFMARVYAGMTSTVINLAKTITDICNDEARHLNNQISYRTAYLPDGNKYKFSISKHGICF